MSRRSDEEVKALALLTAQVTFEGFDVVYRYGEDEVRVHKSVFDASVALGVAALELGDLPPFPEHINCRCVVTELEDEPAAPRLLDRTSDGAVVPDAVLSPGELEAERFERYVNDSLADLLHDVHGRRR